jgi:hypothetical protein
MSYEVFAVPSYPFPKVYIDRILSILEKYDPFVIFGIDDEKKKYSIFDFSYGTEILGQTYLGYLDRNIVSYSLQFLEHEHRTVELQQLALSCLIFLNLYEAKYELSHAVLEVYDTTVDSSRVLREINGWNHVSDLLHSTNIQYVLDFLLSGNNNLPQKNFHENLALDISTNDFQPGTSWYSAYVHTLKLATIQKKNLDSIAGIDGYFNWIVNSYKSDTSCVYFSLFFLSSKYQHKQIYKHLKQIRNIAWDLSQITTWFNESREHIEKGGICDVLVTNDTQLKEIAILLARSVRSREDSDFQLLNTLEKYYSEFESRKIFDLFEIFEKDLKKNDRRKRGYNDLQEKKAMISELEEELSPI